ncbi:protein Skeletor, isoforms D/E isoform X2 [Achroia grisella]|uniref:protein Skeletor, isoforms D/E isoform X2 n=1 Tax=Achroia grisella TaxID=688607 RepID=UPI0027D2EF9D|nr:protein Skeletor, isoforms D/E isoform X2 [Achroia grisella]
MQYQRGTCRVRNLFSSIKGDSSLSGDTIRTEVVRNQIYPSGQEYELPISKVQIKEVIQAVESLESQMKEEMRKNTSHSTPSQYQVHEELPEMFVPELPIREGEEYIIEPGKLPDNYMLPPNQKPLTLQSVLRPSGPNRPMGNVRPPYRRPVPPEIKLRRPPPMFQKGNGAGYPLSMPNPHGPQGMQKKPLSHKHSHYPNSRLPPSMNRPHQAALPPMKVMPPLHHDKVGFSQGPPKQIPKLPTGTVQSIIMGKPASNNPTKPTQSQMLNLGQTDIIVNHVVKSQITLPGTNDAVAQHSIPQVFFNKPSSGQIILGKPMDNPQPLDQQMTQTKHQIIRTHPTSIPTEVILSTTHRTREESKPKLHIQDEIKSSDFIGESVPNSSTLKPAVNTGFKVDSIVIESGFKPIIREPLMAAEDRITDGDETNNTNRREDTDVEEDYNESPQYINHAYPSEKQTESFEPMFIPSPPDHLLSTNDRTKEIFPKNHAKEDRPHPVYVKSDEQLNALFSKTNLERDVPSDMVMESDRISPYYLPPDPKINKEQSQKLTTKDEQLNYYTTYDGKNITKSSISTVPEIKTTTKLFSSKLPANPELLLKTPQYGPFIGELPPLVSGAPPIGELTKDQLPDNNDSRTTHLKLVNAFQDSEDLDLEEILSAKASKHYDVIKEAESKNIEDNNEENNESDDEYEEDEEEEEQKDTNVRDKRDTKTTQFERGEIQEQIHTNGHSVVGSQVDFESQQTIKSSSTSLSFTSHLILLMLCLKMF